MFVTIADIEKVHKSFTNQDIKNFNQEELTKCFKEQNVPLDIKDFKLAKLASDMDFSYQIGHTKVTGTVHQKDYAIHHFELKHTILKCFY